MSLRHHVPADEDPNNIADLYADCATLRTRFPEAGIPAATAPAPVPAPWNVGSWKIDTREPIPDLATRVIDGMSDYGD